MFRSPKNSSQAALKKQKPVGLQKNKGRCKFPTRKCNFQCLENYDYCLKHILLDKSAPYKPCVYTYCTTAKKCGKPAAYRPERKESWLCAQHVRKTQLVTHKETSRPPPVQTPETLLASLRHYAKTNKPPGAKTEGEDKTVKSSHAVNPFVDIDAAQVNVRCSKILDYASESDSDVESATLDNLWRAQDHESSDAESIDSQSEDYLKHAGVYTAEEVTVVIKDKMIRLQSLYIDQFRRLQHLLKERRRKYLHALKKEKETLCSIHSQEKKSASDLKQYQKLKALNHFHKYYGEEAILHKKALERRAQVTVGNIARTFHKGKCAFTEGGVKCGAKTLPATKYCRKHILEDSQQVLFRACGFNRDDLTCKEPTLNVFENATCVYHTVLPRAPHSLKEKTPTNDEMKEEGKVTKNQPDNIVNDSKLIGILPQKCSEDQVAKEVSQEDQISPDVPHSFSSPIAANSPSDPCNISSESTISNNVSLDHGYSASCSPESERKMVLKTELSRANNSTRHSVVEENTKTLEQKAEDKGAEGDVKMEIDSMHANEMKNSESDELVMVDVSDVGVVEEVLEAEGKAAPENTGMQFDLGNEMDIGVAEEVFESEENKAPEENVEIRSGNEPGSLEELSKPKGLVACEEGMGNEKSGVEEELLKSEGKVGPEESMQIGLLTNEVNVTSARVLESDQKTACEESMKNESVSEKQVRAATIQHSLGSGEQVTSEENKKTKPGNESNIENG